MKTLFIMLIVGICAVAWRSPGIMQAVGRAGSAQDPAITVSSLGSSAPQQGMSVEEFARLAKTDPDAYQKFIGRYRDQERSEADKFLNFFARGKYE